MNDFTPADIQILDAVRYQLSQRPVYPLPQSPAVQAPLPIHRLPQSARDLVTSSASTIGVHPEIALACLFAAVFIAARGNFRVRLADNHTEALTEYILVSAPSGQRKSAIVEFFRAVLISVQAEMQAAYIENGSVNDRNILNAAVKKAEAAFADQLQKKTAELGAVDLARAALADDLKAIESLRKSARDCPSLPRLLVDTSTPEALAFEMTVQGEAIGIFEAEGGIWKNRLPSSRDDIVLKAYTGEPFASDTRTQGAVRLQSPIAAICNLVQPNVFNAVYTNTDLVEHGLVPRVLPLIAPSWTPLEIPLVSEVPIHLADWYEKLIRDLLKIQRPAGQDGMRTIHTLDVSTEAKAEFDRFSQYCRGLYVASAHDGAGGYQAFLNKLPGHAVRLAGAVHLMKCPSPQNHPIDAESMQCGTAFADYFRLHAHAAFDESTRDGVSHAPLILKWLRRHRHLNFTERLALRGVGSNRHKVFQVRAGLDVLSRHGYVQGAYISKGLIYVTNPNLG